MSQQTIQQRAAAIRRSWSRNERRQRAVASDHRCLDLLAKISTGTDRCRTTWSTKTSA
jgi:hypothetical protein